MLLWYAVLIILMIALTKFMFICVWKSMPAMNDDLLVRIALFQAVFFSVLFSSTASFVVTGNTTHMLLSAVFLKNYHNF